MEISFWAATDAGRVREINEDNFLVDKALNLFVVCDGMGGHAAGEVASAAAARILREVIAANRKIIERCRLEPSPQHHRDVLTLLEFAVRDACARLHRMAASDASRRGMGTTLSALVVCGARAFVAHVGDSRIYLLRGGQVHQLTEDHTLVNELVKRGRLTESEVAELPIKNAVTRAVGVYESVEVDTHTLNVQARDRFLLCSDGLHNYLPDEQSVVPLLAARDASAIARRAVDFANRCGGKDNITAVVLELGEQPYRAQDLDVLRHTPPFAALTADALETIAEQLSRRSLRPGGRLLLGGANGEDALALVASGAVRLVRSGLAFGDARARHCLGLRSLFVSTRDEPALEAVATEPCELLVLGCDALRALLAADPELAAQLLWNAAQLLADSLPPSSEPLTSSERTAALVAPWHLAEADDTEPVADGFSRQDTTAREIADLTHEVELVEVQNVLESGEFIDPDELVVEDDELRPEPMQHTFAAPQAFPTPDAAAAAARRVESPAVAPASPEVRRPRTEPQTPVARPRTPEPPLAPTPEVARTGYARRDTLESDTSPPQPRGLSASERFARLRSMFDAPEAEEAPPTPRDDLVGEAVDDLQRRYADRLGRAQGRIPGAARHSHTAADDDANEQTVRTVSPYFRPQAGRSGDET